MIQSLLEEFNLQLLYVISVDISQVCHGTPFYSLTLGGCRCLTWGKLFCLLQLHTGKYFLLSREHSLLLFSYFKYPNLLLEPWVVWYEWLKTRDCRTVICDMLVFPCLFTGYCPKPSTWNTKRKLSEYQAQINSQCLVNAFFADYTSLIYMRVPTNMGLLFSLWSDLLVHPRVLEVELQVKPF